MLISVSRRDRYQRSFNDYSRLDRFVTRLACTTVRCSIVLPWCNDVEIRTDRLTTDPWKSFDPIGHGPCVWKPLHEIPRSFVTSGNRIKHNAFYTHLLVSSHSISYTLYYRVLLVSSSLIEESLRSYCRRIRERTRKKTNN